jgi:hypothetical protein
VATTNGGIGSMIVVFVGGEGLTVVGGYSGGLLQLRGREGGVACINFNGKAREVVLTEDGDGGGASAQIQ